MPNRSHLPSRGHKLLQTNDGPLDVLATIETNTTFEDLLLDSDWLEVDCSRVRLSHSLEVMALSAFLLPDSRELTVPASVNARGLTGR
ncbi:MAG TPA: hypothetical protein VIK01_02870 [Polyangiaceae bacterium]